MINPANEALRESIFDLEGEMLTIKPEAGLEKIHKISILILAFLRTNDKCTISEWFFINPLIMRVTALSAYFSEKTPIGQTAIKTNDLIK